MYRKCYKIHYLGIKNIFKKSSIIPRIQSLESQFLIKELDGFSILRLFLLFLFSSVKCAVKQAAHNTVNSNGVKDSFELQSLQFRQTHPSFFVIAKRFFYGAIMLLALVLLSENISSQTNTTYNIPGNHIFTIPAGVSNVTIEAWGGGGSAGNKNNDARGGGGGGGYVTNTYSVTGGQTISIVVGAGGVIPNYSIDGGDNGDNSSYNYENNGDVIAGGGLCSTNSTKAEDNGGPGGSISGNYDSGKVGGNGADRVGKDSQGGGGGGSGSTTTDASGQTGGTPNGGNGGNINQSGEDGTVPGGGGGGKGDGDENTYHSGNGENGQVVVSWLPVAPPNCTTPISPTNGEIDFAVGDDLIWNAAAGASSYDIYFEVGDSNPEYIDNVTVTNYTPSSTLIPLTNYFWKVVPKNSIGDASGCSIWSFTTGNVSYCTSSGNMDFVTGITLVDFNTINNITAKPSGYSDYTNLSTDLATGSSYDLSLNLNTDVDDGNWTIFAIVWIDWNQDGIFNTTDEEYELGTTTNNADGITTNSPLSITVPAAAELGNTRMRVSCRWADPNGYPTSCETGHDGEVEDYTINVLPTCTTPPVANCKNINAQLDASGSVNITGSDVDNGSTADCGLQSLTVVPNSFTCNEVGDNTVTLTVKDANDNISTCDATVSVEDNIFSVVTNDVDSIYNTPGGPYLFTVPAGVSSITLQAWAGGGSAGNKNDDARGGGGGGGYVTNAYSVTGGQTISIVVGAGGVIPNYSIDGGDNGDNSSYNYENNGDVIAGGGLCSTNSTKAEDNGGPGGSISGNYDSGKVGGNGADRVGKDSQGGGGGGSGSTTTDASGQTGGTPNGGNGGNINQSGEDGTVPGGGGGGKGDGDENTYYSGNGADGQVVVSWEGSSSGAVCQDITVQLDTSGEVSINTGQIDNGSSDACGIASLVLDKTLFTCTDLGTNTVTLTATDNNGNIATCDATVTVEQSEPIDIIDIAVIDLGNSCQGGETGSTTIITWDINLLQGSNSWTYNYTINDGTTDVEAGTNVSATGNIQISYTMNNQTTTNKTYTITITNVKDECGAAEVNTGNNSDSATLYGVPNTGEIIPD